MLDPALVGGVSTVVTGIVVAIATARSKSRSSLAARRLSAEIAQEKEASAAREKASTLVSDAYALAEQVRQGTDILRVQQVTERNVEINRLNIALSELRAEVQVTRKDHAAEVEALTAENDALRARLRSTS